MKKYKGGFTCLHCEIEKTIEKHHWIGDLSSRKKKWIILKDLINVIFDLIFYSPSRR